MSVKALFINEKPSVSREFQTALKVKEDKKHDGYIQGYSSVLGFDVCITWCVGHLITLSYPEKYDENLKEWREEDLPFLPKKYLYEVIPDVKAQFKVVKTLINSMTAGSTIYYAGDSAREGIYIQALVRKAAGINKEASEKVVWIDSQTEDEIRKGIVNAKPFTEYQNLIDSAYERAIEDYATGINLSRMFSLKYGQKANAYAGTSTYRSIAVGRVMTCVLGMIVNREREIENFVVTPFYKIESNVEGVKAEWKAVKESKLYNSPLLYNETGFKQESDAEKFMDKLPNTILVEKIEKKTEKKYAPFLFSLAELQSECTKAMKISPDQTLNIAQSLYEKKLTTYPRTDARVLSSAVATEIVNNIKGIRDKYNGECSEYAGWIINEGRYENIAETQYVDDSKISDHYAIIPTGTGFDSLSQLSKEELFVYDLIVRRFLSIFMPPAEYSVVKLTEDADGEKFFASKKKLLSPGYLKILKNEEDKQDEEFDIERLQEGRSYPVMYGIKKGETTPPKRYTSGSMILAMENAGNLIEDEKLRAQIKGSGIGTSATRAETIKKLVKQEFINLNKKTQILTPAPFGNITYEIVNDTVPELLNPKMTASWERGLDRIVTGRITAEEYRKTLEDYVRKEVNIIKGKADDGHIDKKLERFKNGELFVSQPLSISCPVCGSSLRTTKYGCICNNYKKDAPIEEYEDGSACKFVIGQIAGKILSIKELEQLIVNKRLDDVKGFKSKAGNKFDATLTLSIEKDEEGINRAKTDLVFSAPSESRLKCIRCGKNLVKGRWKYECECGFEITHVIAKKDISETQIKKLLDEGKSDLITGFTSKAGKKFDAYLVFDETDGVKFDFPKRKD